MISDQHPNDESTNCPEAPEGAGIAPARHRLIHMQTFGTCSHVVSKGEFSDMRPRSTATATMVCSRREWQTEELAEYALVTGFTLILTSKMLLNCTDRRFRKLISRLQISRDRLTSNTPDMSAHRGASIVFIVICLSPRLFSRGPPFAHSTCSSRRTDAGPSTPERTAAIHFSITAL